MLGSIQHILYNAALANREYIRSVTVPIHTCQ
jgi:hypothetical protein